MATKQWYQSKTVWLNVIGCILAVLALASQTFPMDEHIVVFVVGVGNILLRVLEGKPIMVGGKKLGKE